MKRKLFTLALLVYVLVAQAQMMNPVHFSSQLKQKDGGEAELVFTATIDAGWHVYSTGLGNDGPISATFKAVKMDGAETVGKLQARGHEIKQYDKMFEMELRYFEKSVTFVQKIRFTKPEYDIDCYVEYGACNDESCIPPSEAPLTAKGKSPVVEKREDKESKKEAEADGDVVEQPTAETVAADTTLTIPADAPTRSLSDLLPLTSNDLWAPVIDELHSEGGNDNML